MALLVLAAGTAGCNEAPPSPPRSATVAATSAEASTNRVPKASARPLLDQPTTDQPKTDQPATDQVAASGVPKLVVDKAIFQFGSMERNEVRSHQFVIRNEGDALLEMSEMAASCKCLSMQLSATRIAPGGQGVLRVQWRGAESAAVLTQRVRIRTNDPANEIFEFTVLGSISSVVSIEPGRIELPPLVIGEPVTTRVLVTSGKWPAMNLSDIACSIAGVETTTQPVTPSELARLQRSADAALPKSGVWVDVTFPEGVIDGRIDGELTFTASERPASQTGSNSQTEPDSEAGQAAGEIESRSMRVAIAGELRQQLAVIGPGVLDNRLLKLGRAKQGSELRKKFLIKISDDLPKLVIREQQVTPEYLQVAIEPYQAGATSSLYRMEVVVPAGKATAALMGENLGKIHVQFDHPRVRELHLDVELAPST